MPSVLEEPIQARGELEKKCAFFAREGVSLISWLGGAEVAWSSSNGCQGQALACPKSLAQEVKAMGLCVCMSSSTMKLSMEAWELAHKMN